MKVTIDTYDNYQLYGHYDRVDNAKGTIVFSHGFVEYAAHYSRLAAMFHKHGYSVFRYDMRGHGRSTMPLGDVSDYMDFADDLNRCVEWIKEQTDLPLFVMGFSLGGMVTALYTILYPYEISGAIFIGAGLKIQKQFENLTQATVSVLDFLKMMGTTGDEGIKQLVSMDSPYIIKEASASFLYQSLFLAQTFIQTHINRIEQPVLLLHGRHDPIINVQTSIDFYDALETSDKRLKIYEDEMHDLLRVGVAPDVVAEIARWCDLYI